MCGILSPPFPGAPVSSLTVCRRRRLGKACNRVRHWSDLSLLVDRHWAQDVPRIGGSLLMVTSCHPSLQRGESPLVQLLSRRHTAGNSPCAPAFPVPHAAPPGACGELAGHGSGCIVRGPELIAPDGGGARTPIV